MNRPPPAGGGPPAAPPPIPPAAPPAAPPGTLATPLNTQLLANLIRHWVYLDNSIGEYNKQLKDARDARNNYESQILTMLRTANMTNPVIQIGGGRLVVANERHSQPLSFKALEEYLTNYYRLKPGARNETNDILKFIRAQRQVEVTQILRRQKAGSTPRVKDKDPNSQ